MLRNLVLLTTSLLLMAAANLWVSSFRTQAKLAAEYTPGTDGHGWNMDSGQAVVRGAFWELRRSLAILTWAEAQTYFHGGFDLTRFSVAPDADAPGSHAHDDEHSDEDDHPAAHDQAGVHEDAHDHHDHDDHADDAEIKREEDLRVHTPEEIAKIRSVFEHPFLRRSTLRPYVFDHAHGEEGPKRMMPFYWFTTLFDPHFIRAYTNGAYWLAMKFGQPEQALKYLDTGLSHNPRAASLYAMRGHIYFTVLNDYPAAIRELRKALSYNLAQNEEQRDELIETLRYLGRAHIFLLDYDSALQVAYAGKRIDPIVLTFDLMITEITTTLEGHPQD
jgi:hypothetical protein